MLIVLARLLDCGFVLLVMYVLVIFTYFDLLFLYIITLLHDADTLG